MLNQFDTEVALDVGINAAILYKNIQYWCEKNRTNGQNFYDGYYWTFNSMKAFAEQFPYLSEAQVRQALKVLEEKGYIKSGNYNKRSYDRTKWYADLKSLRLQSKESSDSICYPSQMELLPISNASDTDNRPIPNINTNINTEDNINISSDETILDSLPDEPKRKKFIPPTVEEVAEYCKQRKNNIDAEEFVSWYGARNWMSGKTKITNWKLCIITWEKRKKNDQKSSNPFIELAKEEGYL